MAEVSVSGLKKAYGSTDVIHGVDFDVADGEFVALVGPSGCGKSTLLRMIAGLEDISQGTISIGGRRVNDVAPKERDIAMVFQNYALYPHMTVAKNMGFSLYLHGGTKKEIERRVDEAAAMLGLTDYLDRLPGQLSGGQRQRVAMGRAIVRQPSVFLFDEPLSNLDAALRVQMRADIRALHDRLGTTSIFVTHDQVEAMTMSDRIIVLKAGRLEQAGSPLDLYDRPQNAFVAGFIGSPAMNLLPATVAEGRVVLADTVSVPAQTTLSGSVTWGIRPEHLDWAPGAGEGVLSGKVAGLERTGSSDLVITECAGQRITALFQERHPIARGSAIHLRPRPGHSHFFDAESGARVQ
ncbi:sn-glycerol-3-phosphate ABC transporter ATP-binding protein UgpC [Pelagibacterium sp. H642]|uniref:ABC transporter ATP-binding protein n=1 Tax=Pelagibacterium sp. H642 TaxID=1881069 RepID=UPI002814F03E|nr:sn-glycerol-3-phosphate ABC transporter ATP-binding protein UgpC [Pelagibacterium sp. H642]WMT92662.1 sn-glycerol-3-phosphate ABC transporter ATP-binding protein UgpC [Pelagibacterium sp. H642]